MTIVADAGPIISFARAGYEDLLCQVLPEMIIPEAPSTMRSRSKAQGNRAHPRSKRAAGSSGQVSPTGRPQVDRLSESLGAGEREAIVLAKELRVPLLIDDRTARGEAEEQGIACSGSLRVLKEAKGRGILKGVRPVVDALRRSGLHISAALYRAFLLGIGE